MGSDETSVRAPPVKKPEAIVLAGSAAADDVRQLRFGIHRGLQESAKRLLHRDALGLHIGAVVETIFVSGSPRWRYTTIKVAPALCGILLPVPDSGSVTVCRPTPFSRSASLTSRRPVVLPSTSSCSGNSRKTSARNMLMVCVALPAPELQHCDSSLVSTFFAVFTTVTGDRETSPRRLAQGCS